MKIFRFAFLMMFVLASSYSLASESISEKPHVSVAGTAMQEVKPDVTRWSISVNTEGKQTESVAQEQTVRLQKLLAFLEAQQIDKNKIKTESMRLDEQWNYHNGKRSKQGYIASSTLTFESDITSYQTLWSGLSELDGIQINGSSFELSKRIDIENQVRTEALLAAKQKASSMAKALGASIGKPIYIEDLNWGDDVIQPMAEMRMKTMSSAQQDMVSPGSLEIRMRVKVLFELK